MMPMFQNGIRTPTVNGNNNEPQQQQQQQPPMYHQNNNNNNTNTNNVSGVNTNTGGGTLPVGLTRLTSQVSDWLNFFWPTNNNSNNNNNGNVNAQNAMNEIHNNSSNNIGTGSNEQYSHNANTIHPTTMMYERQVSAEAAAILAAASNRPSNASATMAGRNNGIATPVELYRQQSQQSQQFSALSQQQQQQQQQSDVTIESLLQLHRQLSNDIDSTPFTSLFRANSF